MPHRLEKINELILQNLTEIFYFNYPGEIVTILSVIVSPDLAFAKIFISVLDNEKLFNKINFDKKAIRKLLAEKIELRKTPILQFINCAT